MPGDQALFPMGPMTNAPRPAVTGMEFSTLQWVIYLGSITLFVLVVGLLIHRILRQRRQPVLHSADERLLRERNAPQDVIDALGELGRARQLGTLSEDKYAELRAELLSGI